MYNTIFQLFSLMTMKSLLAQQAPKGSKLLQYLHTPFSLRYLSSINDLKPTKEFLQKHLSLPSLPVHVFNHEEAYLKPSRALIEGMSGVYIWFCIADNKCYIGGAKDLNERPFRHMQPKGPRNKNFLTAVDTLGRINFFLIIQEIGKPSELSNKDELVILEQRYLDCVPFELQYNFSLSASMPKGSFKRSDEFKKNLSEKHSGSGNPTFGLPLSETTLQRQRVAKTRSGHAVEVDVFEVATGLTTRFASKHATAVGLEVPQSTVDNAYNSGKLMWKRWILKRVSKDI